MSETAPLGDGSAESRPSYNPALHEAAQLEEQYVHGTAEFRRDVLSTLRNLTGVVEPRSWAIYTLPSRVAPGDYAEYNNNREILFLAHVAEPAPVPVIRILTNELFKVNDTTQYLTEDFILDHENDAQYYIDAAEIKNAVIKNTSSPIFIVDGGKLQLYNCPLFPPQVLINVHPEDRKGVIPFGNHKNIKDKLDALAIGRELLGEVIHSDPIAWGTS